MKKTVLVPGRFCSLLNQFWKHKTENMDALVEDQVKSAEYLFFAFAIIRENIENYIGKYTLSRNEALPIGLEMVKRKY